jgi:hypothetical protein
MAGGTGGGIRNTQTGEPWEQNTMVIVHSARLRETIPSARLATMARPGPLQMLFGFPPRFMLETMNRRSNIYRALVINPGSAVYQDEQRVYARNLEVPSGGGVGTARAIAHAYSVFATGGRDLGLRPETLDLLAAPAIPPTRGFYDECMKADGIRFSLGFMKPSPVWPFGSASSDHPAPAALLALPIRRPASATPT